eukprot:jgi/Tetstr1/427831/TSEL_001803.t1
MLEEPEDGEAIEQDVNGDNDPEAEAGAMQAGGDRSSAYATCCGQARRFEDMNPEATKEDGTPLATTPLPELRVAQAKQARVVATRVASKYGHAPQVGDPVQIDVPGVDRGKVDATTCTLVVIEVTDRSMHMLANMAGVINRKYGEVDLALMRQSDRYTEQPPKVEGMKTREEQLQEWRERRGIHRPALKPRPLAAANTNAPGPPNPALRASEPAFSALAAQKEANESMAKRPRVSVDGQADKENAHADVKIEVAAPPSGPPPASPFRPITASATVPARLSAPMALRPAQVPGAAQPHQANIVPAPRDSLLGQPPTASQPAGTPSRQPSAGFGAAGNLLRERMSILRRESAAVPGNPGAESFSRLSFFDGDIGAPGVDNVTNLEELARQLFQVPETVAQCDRALGWQLKSSKDGATKDSRIAELAELTKLARRLLKQLLGNNTQFVNTAVSVQRQLEQQVEGIRLQQMSANSAHEALKAEMARSQAELAQAQSAHKQETVEMQLEKERLDAEVKRLGRTIQQLEGEKAEAVSQRAEAVSREQAATRAHAELMATVESANRQRDQSLNAAAAAREVELAATTRANEVEAAAADALKKASKAEAEASMALASRQAAEVKADAARVTLAAREKELAALQAEQQEILESSQAVLKDYEELQGRCNDMLADLNVKAASLESVNAQLAAEEGHRQELTVQLSSARTEVQQLKDKSSSLQADIEVKSSSIDRMAKQLAAQMDRCGSLEAQVSKLQADVQEGASREATLADAKASLELQTAQASDVQAALKAELEGKMGELAAEKATLESRLAEAESALAAATARVEELSAANEMDALREVAGIAAGGGKEGDMVSALLSRVAALESAALEAHKERRALHNALVDLRGNIRVFCRVRPTPSGQPSAVACAGDGHSVRVTSSRSAGKPTSFAFDKVFAPGTAQATVFEEVSELVQSALDGYNVCLFSYGQTGAGKTHTMQGGAGPEARGIIPRAVNQLLCAIQKLTAQGWDYRLEASFVEIYNESIRDLLADGREGQPPTGGLGIQHAGAGGGHTHVAGAVRLPVETMEGADEIMRRAEGSRAVEATAMNATSSRSHSVFMLYCTGVNADAGIRLTGALNLVDLAGSERLARSKVEGARQKEACAINKSLSALGDVFAALSSKAGHVPYRNSKLTHLLQPCLGGDGKTLMFVNINPEEASADESLCSLKFAAQVHQCETGAKGGAKRNMTSLPADVDSADVSAHHIPGHHRQSLGPSQRRDGAAGRRDSLGLSSRSKPPLKRSKPAFGK